MTAAVGLPTLRLVRVAVGAHRLDAMTPGEWLAPGQWRRLDRSG
jgi:23S rRNA pseudouridine2457 synthase